MAKDEGKRKIFVWDVDGVILDSAKETHVVSMEALKRHKHKVESAFGGKLKDYPYKQFYEDRPFVAKAHHCFVHAISRSFRGKNAAQLGEKERQKIYEDYKQLFDDLSKTFYDVRKELQSKDMKKWNDLNPVYPGIPEAMKELHDAGFKFVVVSSKDKGSIWGALKHHGLDRFFSQEDILDTTTGKDRKEQMGKMIKRYGVDSEYVIVDDLPENHVSSKPSLSHAKVRYFGARWGYGVGWEKHKFITVIKSPKELARELHLKAVLKEHVTRHRAVIRVPFLGHYVFGERTTRQEADEKKLKHVIVSVLIRDDKGNILMQKRSSSKKDYPGLFTVSASGGVRHLERIEKAAEREAKEELGVSLKDMIPLWKKPVAIDPAHPNRLFFPFVADYSGSLKPNPAEVNVKETQFYSPKDVEGMIEGGKLTPPARNLLRLVEAKSKELKKAA